MNAPLRAGASDPAHSRGRLRPEPADPQRNAFQRDRDRIVHSTAFRRLVYKTQVFLNHEGDMFRTRLTHSLEVAQIGRSIARVLGLHEDLVEAIALAHDLGHTPFGHAGQDALHAALIDCAPVGQGFEHNLQSLRVVDLLEEQYPTHDGLNLCFETREGVLKHCSHANALRLEAREPGGVARRFIDRTRPSLEAQLCNLADEMAYNAHDIDDGLRAGLLQLEDLLAVPLYARHHAAALGNHPHLSGRRLVAETTRRLLTSQVHDVVAASLARWNEAPAGSAEAVRHRPAVIGFSPPMEAEVVALKQVLRHKLYRHPQVMDTTNRARRVVRELFHAYRCDPSLLPAALHNRPVRPRQVADYLAGMTDRFALREHRRITGVDVFDVAAQP